MKRLFLCVLCAIALDAQSISITHPASGDVVTGFGGYQFQVALNSAPTVTLVCYTVDTYAAYNPGINAPTTLGCSLTPPFSYPYDSYWNADGPHKVVATAYNSMNTVVATSAAVPFTTGNIWPVACTDGSAPVWSVSASTAITSNWSGSVLLTATVAGSCSTDSKTFTIYVDGVLQGTAGGTAASETFNLYTTQFQNGTHYVCERFDDNTNQSVISAVNITAAGDWCAAVNIQNGAVETAQAQLASDKIYLTPGGSSGGNCQTAGNGSGSCTETAEILNTDGSLTRGTPVFAIEANTATFTTTSTVATVNQSSGVLTAVSNGMANIAGMVPVFTGNVLATGGAVCYQVATTSGPEFTPLMNGWLLNITSGTGFTPGVYVISSVNTTGVATITNLSGVTTCPAAANTAGGVFATGPTRVGQVFVWSGGNTMPCLGSNGARYTTYNASCFVMHDMFVSNGLLTADPPFSPGMPAYINAGGLNTFEIGAPQTPFTGLESTSGQATWSAQQSAYTALWESYIAGYPKLGFWLIGDNITGSSQGLYGATTGPAAFWTIPGPELVWAKSSPNSWSGYGNVRGVSMKDEVTTSWSTSPLQGPLTFGISPQSWLSSIIASSGTCTVSTGSSSLRVAINAAREFLITGSAISGMNSVYPNHYAASTGTSTGFTFPCPAVANGTYGTGGTSDPGLQIEPYATGWQVNSPTGFTPVTVFATLASQFASSGATFGMGWPPAGTGYCEPEWWGNSAQSIAGVSQVANFVDIYQANGNSNYLIQRMGTNTILRSGLNMGWTLRTMYGCYNPQLPLVMISQGVGVGTGGFGYGLTGYTVPVASTSGNTITFSAPHGITNIIPGMTRLSIGGATDSGGAVDTTNSVINTTNPTQTTAFYVLACRTTTTCTVAMSLPDFSVSGSGGTITYANGNTKALNSFNASTSQTCDGSLLAEGICGSQSYYSGSSDTTQMRNYGYTFTLSGVAGTVTTNSNCLISASCNLSRTFQMLAENLNPPNSTHPTQLMWREIPILSASGGMATIVVDNNYVKGRNYTAAYDDTNPDYAAGEEFECQIMRCAGTRIYRMSPAMSGYSSANGFSSPGAQSEVQTFADNTLGGQFFTDPYFENGQGVPIYHAHSIPALAWERWDQFCAGEPRRNSPDFGYFFDVGATADCILFWNATDAPQTVTIPTSVQLKAGQQFIQQIVTGHSIGAETITAAGTTSVTVTIPAAGAAFLVFPPNLAAQLLRPSITPEINTITNAASSVIVYSYDPYYLDVGGNTFNCGTAAVCQPAWDRNIGTIYYRLEYLNINGVRIAQSAVQTL